MAGVPGMTVEQKKAALRASMRPGDSLMETSPGNWTIMRAAKRDTGESAAGALGTFADKVGLKRVAAGMAASLYGLDETGNPTFGKTPGLYYDTLSMGTLPSSILRGVQDYIANSAVPGLTELPDYQMVQKALFADPEWATKAVDKSIAIDDAVHEDMKLAPPQGFGEHFQENLGTMLTQLPLPGGTFTKGAKAAPGAGRKIAGWMSEYLTPTIDPKIGNYVAGTSVGTGLGLLGDYGNEQLEETTEEPGYEDLPPEGLSDEEYEQWRNQRGYAKGSLVSKYFKDVNKKVGTQYRTDIAPGVRPPNTQEYLDLIDKHALKLPKRRSQLRLIEDFSDEGPWDFRPHENRNLLRIMDKYGVELPPDVPLYRGVSGLAFDFDSIRPYRGLTPRVGEELIPTPLPTTSLSSSKGSAQDFASAMDPEHWANYIINVGRDRPIKAFPMMTSGHSEWVVPTKRGKMMVKRVRKDPAEDYTDVDIDYNQFAKGGMTKKLRDWLEIKKPYYQYGPVGEGDTKKFLLAKKAGFNPELRDRDVDLLQYQAEVGTPRLTDMEYHDWNELIDAHAVEAPGDLRTFRGVRLMPDTPLGEYARTASSADPLYTTFHTRMAKRYAAGPIARGMDEGDAETLYRQGKPYLLTVTPEPGARIFPNLAGIPNEVIYPRGHKLSEPVKMKKTDKILADWLSSSSAPQIVEKHAVKVGHPYPRRKNFEEGGSVKDHCEGGMATISSMKRKYAAGGPTGGDPVQAITDALAHLDQGDSSAALQAIQRSPQAMQDPGIQRAIQGFAKGGMAIKKVVKKLRKDMSFEEQRANDALYYKRWLHRAVAEHGDNPFRVKGAEQEAWRQRGKIPHEDAVKIEEELLGGGPPHLTPTGLAKPTKKAKGGSVAKVVKRAAMTLAEAKKIVRGHGHTLVKEDGEYIVKKKGSKTRIEGDDPHYFTNDIEDAVGTSEAMTYPGGVRPKKP